MAEVGTSARNAMRRRVCLLACGLFLGVFAQIAAAHAQTADETIAYVNGKLKGKEISFAAYSIKYDDVQLNGSVFTVVFQTENDFGSLGRTRVFVSESIDLTKVADFTQKSIDALISSDDNVLRLQCERSHSRCVLRRTCAAVSVSADGKKCADVERDNLATLHIELGAMNDLENVKRVKRAIVHLKSLFPFKKNVELFDKQ